MVEENVGIAPMLVRGISLISFREYVKSKLSGKDLEVFFSRLSIEDLQIILSVNKNEWHPFSVQRRLREQIAAWFNPENPKAAIFDACLFTAEYEMSSFLKGIMSFLPVHLVMRQTANLWDKYYKPGKMSAISLGDTRAALELTEFPADKLFGPTMTAWLTIAMKHLGLKNPEASQTADIHDGDNCWRWELYWE